MAKPIIFRDPVHVQIRFDRVELNSSPRGLTSQEQTSWVLQRIIGTDSFQRLRLIRQNGLANYVFHGAEHSRFSHSLGVLNVARTMFERICRNLGRVEDEALKMEVLIAALVHDVGHGAFSHTLEEIMKENRIAFHHEQMTRAYVEREDSPICRIISEIDASLPACISTYFNKKGRADHWKYKIVSSEMDADRLDYSRRDAMFCGIKGHGFDYERLVDLISVHDERSIAIDRGAIEAVEAYLVTLDQLYRSIYYHQAVRSSTQMLLSLFRRAVELHKRGTETFPAIGKRPSPMVAIIEKGGEISLEEYGGLCDSTVWQLIQFWKDSSDLVMSALSRMLLKRDLLKAISLKNKDFNAVSALKERAIELTADVLGSKEAAPFFVTVDDQSRTSYKGYNFNPESDDESIWLTGGNEIDRPLQDEPDSAIVVALKNQMHFPRLIVLDEVRRILLS